MVIVEGEAQGLDVAGRVEIPEAVGLPVGGEAIAAAGQVRGGQMRAVEPGQLTALA